MAWAEASWEILYGGAECLLPDHPQEQEQEQKQEQSWWMTPLCPTLHPWDSPGAHGAMQD